MNKRLATSIIILTGMMFLLMGINAHAVRMHRYKHIADDQSFNEQQSQYQPNNNVFIITTRFFEDGKLIARPRLIAREGQEAVLSQGNQYRYTWLRMKVLAKSIPRPNAKSDIELDFDVSYQNYRDKMHDRPRIILKPGEERKLLLSSDTDHQYVMYVVAQKE